MDMVQRIKLVVMISPVSFVELGFKLRSEFNGIYTLMLAPRNLELLMEVRDCMCCGPCRGS